MKMLFIASVVVITGCATHHQECATKIALERDKQASEQIANEELPGGRTLEELRQTIDSNKQIFYSIYAKALRKQSSLCGSVKVELVMENTGKVSSCKVIESTLNNPDMESKICDRLLLVNFEPKPNAGSQTFKTQFDFIPG